MNTSVANQILENDIAQNERPSDGPAAPERLNVSVIVPTYHRPDDLLRCLDALCGQERLADEVVVVMRDSDEQSHAALAAWEQSHAGALPLRRAIVSVPGQVAALNTGLEAARGDILAITDDDAAPQPQWLARAEEYFVADPAVAGVGGRDWIHEGGNILDGERPTVGRIQYWGRSVGNHHLGVGGAREVETLKGVNMIYRRSAVGAQRFDTRLRGNGAQIHNDMAFSLGLRSKGWKLIYDPIVAVDHFPAPRHDEDQRGAFNAFAHQNIVYNETMTLLGYLSPPRRIAFLAWMLLVGTGGDPGLVQIPRLLARRVSHLGGRWTSTVMGRVLGARAYFRAPAERSPRAQS